jgi:hypothetical protein
LGAPGLPSWRSVQIGLARFQLVAQDAQAGRHAAEGVDLAHLVAAKPIFQKLDERGDLRRSARADDGVDLVGSQPSLRDHLVQRGGDPGDLLVDQPLEFRARDRLLHAEAGPIQPDQRDHLAGKLALGGFDGVEYLQAVAAGDQLAQHEKLSLLLSPARDVIQHPQEIRAVELDHLLPIGERLVKMERHGQAQPAVVAVVAALAKVARQQSAHQLLIEHVTGDRYAARRQDAPRLRIAQPRDRNIERAAAEVEDQDVLRAVDGRFVKMRGGDGFGLQIDFVVSSQEGRVNEALGGQLILLRIGRKAHRTS